MGWEKDHPWSGCTSCTASQPRLRRKFRNYYTYTTSGEFRRDGYRLPQILIIVPDEGRARTVREVIPYEARVYGCDPLPEWVAIQSELDERGPGAPVWREVTHWRFEHCFEGFRSPPESARMSLDLANVRRQVSRQNKVAQTRSKKRESLGSL